MTMFKAVMTRYLKDESGATAIEYGLILGLMVVAIIAALTSTGEATSNAFQETADSYP